MKRALKFCTLTLVIPLLLPGCRKFLEVQPEDRYTEDQVFSSEETIRQALTGIYIKMADNSLYGANLTQTTVEMFGRHYSAEHINNDNINFFYYNYYHPTVSANLSGIWAASYAVILKANKFAGKLEAAVEKGIISRQHANILKGEAIGIRAYLHFDLLRLFGPVYAEGADAASIPYYTVASAEVRPLLPARQVLDSVIHDLLTAKALLQEDAVRQGGIRTSGSDFYEDYRNRRMNYFAVEGTLARAYLYGGLNNEAQNMALSVISEAEPFFPWLRYDQILTESTNPDRVFSPEVILGLESPGMYTNYTAFFSPDIQEGQLLTANPSRLALTFEYNGNDYRYTSTWLNSAKGYRTFYKYADIDDKNRSWRFLQPLLRKSELYYILAETETDPARAVGYLNEVRYNRGLPDLDASADLETEISKEYQKEFYGEGQLFFFYKRKNLSVIPDGSSDQDFYGINYHIPLPDSELQLR